VPALRCDAPTSRTSLSRFGGVGDSGSNFVRSTSTGRKRFSVPPDTSASDNLRHSSRGLMCPTTTKCTLSTRSGEPLVNVRAWPPSHKSRRMAGRVFPSRLPTESTRANSASVTTSRRSAGVPSSWSLNAASKPSPEDNPDAMQLSTKYELNESNELRTEAPAPWTHPCAPCSLLP